MSPVADLGKLPGTACGRGDQSSSERGGVPVPNDNGNSSTVIVAAQNKQAALFDAFEDYMGRVSLYSGLAVDYASVGDLAGMAYSMRQAKAYFKAAYGEMAEIISERSGQPEVPAAKKQDAGSQSSSKEWWEE